MCPFDVSWQLKAAEVSVCYNGFYFSLDSTVYGVLIYTGQDTLVTSVTLHMDTISVHTGSFPRVLTDRKQPLTVFGCFLIKWA